MFKPRLSRRLAALAAVAFTAATVAAGYAFAANRATPIGTGIVVVDSNLSYEGGQGAGTGMVLTSSGEVLTNNHVIRGATTVKIVIPGSGRSYTAKVVGYDVTDDVAVLQATGASNLKTIALGTSAGVKVGQAVKAIGNAGGTGSLVTSKGTITGLARTITVDDDSGGTSVLRNLIETNADLVPGDSGGPLLNATGKVIGMDSAASVTGAFRSLSSSDGYAIPISRALTLAKAIAGGKASATIHIGATAFLGIATASTDQSGVMIENVVPGSAADNAGLVTGDLVTAVDGQSIASPKALAAVILAHKPGTQITIAYVDQTGMTQTAQVTLASGPPQ